VSEIKFYMDEHVPPAVSHGLRLRGVDVMTTQESGMLGGRDEDLLKNALSLERVLFSQDQDFLVLRQKGVPHAGIAYGAQQTSIGEVVRGLLLIHDVLTAEEMHGRVEFL
jgi:hypothetical protein